MLWLYLHFPHLLLDHVARSRQQPAPLAVVSDSARQVLQACPAAVRLGVHPGMALKTAISLAPELVMVRTDEDHQQQILEQQAHWLYRYMDRITLYPPDGLVAEAGSVQRLYGSLAAMQKHLQQALSERHLNTVMATGTTPLAARLLARAGSPVCSTDPQTLTQQLDQLPLARAEFDDPTLKRLNRLGLNRLGEVFQLPPAQLARRLTPETLAHVQKIQGQRPDPQTPWQPPHYFRQQADFGLPVEHTQGLLFALQRILTDLESDLQWRQQDTDSLLLVLRHHRHEPTRLRLRTTGPEHRAEAFMNLLRIRLEQHPLAAPVQALELTVNRFLGREATTGQDLLGENPNPAEAWHTLISRLQARLGEQALKHLAPAADHRPERAWCATDIRGLPPRRTQANNDPLPHRPLWLLDSPRPLDVTPDTWFSGPERISGGWWDGERVMRDYYIAQLPSGQLAWVLRDIQGGWFVHGWFG